MWRRDQQAELESDFLAEWPITRPRMWRAHVNKPQSESELKAIRHSIRRGTPFGSEDWISQSAARLKLTHTLRPRGRPPKTDRPLAAKK